RIKAVVKRRSKTPEDSNTLEIGNLKIDKTSYEVTYNGDTLHFARKEFDLPFMLANHPGKVFTREKILQDIWRTDVYVGDRAIDAHIRKIREKIDPESMKTVKGIGYKFETV